jgi:hypothetical protein
LGTALAGAAAGLIGLTVTSCTPAYVTNSTAPVNLIVAAVNGGIPLQSNVRYGENADPPLNFICADFVPVAVAVRNRNPGAPAPNVPAAVLIRSYEVRYFRTDGRAVEGVDVPYRITGQISTAIDVRDSGTSDVQIEVVRNQAKLEPPLSTIFQTAVLTVTAEITLYGETIAGQAVTGSGRMQIDFADYGDDLEKCPAPPSGGGGSAS